MWCRKLLEPTADLHNRRAEEKKGDGAARLGGLLEALHDVLFDSPMRVALL